MSPYPGQHIRPVDPWHPRRWKMESHCSPAGISRFSYIFSYIALLLWPTVYIFCLVFYWIIGLLSLVMCWSLKMRNELCVTYFKYVLFLLVNCFLTLYINFFFLYTQEKISTFCRQTDDSLYGMEVFYAIHEGLFYSRFWHKFFHCFLAYLWFHFSV